MKYQVTGICNAITDILIDISEADFNSLGLTKGRMDLVEADAQAELIEKIGAHKLVMESGGSVANSLIAFGALGGSGALLSSVGDDTFGQHYYREMKELGISTPCEPVAGGITGTCVVLVTPDAERTMQTHLGVSALVSADHAKDEVIKNSEWLFVEGYLVSNPENGQAAVRAAVDRALEGGVKVAFTLAGDWIVNAFRDEVEHVVRNSSIVFANDDEGKALTGEEDLVKVVQALGEMCPHGVVTAGSGGVYICTGGETFQVDAFDCTPTDLTGAGDMFAGSYLYGILNGMSPVDAARHANFMAMKVITQVGPRLENENFQALWGSVTA